MIFPIRPTIFEEESLSSYLYRLAQINYYPSVYSVLNFLDITHNEFLSNQIKCGNGILNHLELDQNDSNRSISYYKSSQKNAWINQLFKKINLKFCPRCSELKKIHKYTWCIKPINMCMEHGVSLVNECYKCFNKITLTSYMQGTCPNCQFSYKETPLSFVDNSLFVEFQLELSKLFFGSMYRINGLVLTDYLILANHCFYLFEGLNSFLDSKTIIKAFSKKNGISDNEYANAFANFHWMMNNFPDNFFIVLDTFFEYKKGPSMYFQKARFEQILSDENYRSIREAYHNYSLQRINNGGIRRDSSVFKKYPKLLEQRLYIRGDETGIRTNKLLRMNVKVKKMSGKVLVNKESLQALEESILVSKKEASLILGIHKSSVEVLVTSGTLAQDQATGKLLRKEIIKLVSDCSGKYVSRPKGLRFQEVLSKYNSLKMNLLNLVEFTRQGLLHPVTDKENGTLANIYYSEKEIKHCLELLKKQAIKQKGYRKQDVMRLLGIGDKTMNKLIDTSVLEPNFISISKNGQKRYYFDCQTVNNYIKSLENQNKLSLKSNS